MELDACCGYRHMWKEKDTSNVIFLDIRKRVKPDIVADSRWLPFRDEVFDKIYCDPPHMIRTDVRSILESTKRGHSKIHAQYFDEYGVWTSRSSWISFLFRTNIEFSRVLKADGTLWYKLIDGKDYRIIKLAEVTRYMDNFELIEKKALPQKKSWSKNVTYELLFKKRNGKP
jgi:hypothetical protein